MGIANGASSLCDIVALSNHRSLFDWLWTCFAETWVQLRQFYSHGSEAWECQMAATLYEENGSTSRVGMVVDDDELVRESVVAMLEELCDRVYQASDGLEGLQVLADHPDISLIVTDIAMPRLDGVAFANRARRLHPELKVLFLSGLQHPPGKEEFLPKPFMRRALLSAVQHMLAAD
jgi:CheY-like chemotaxis protein